tara:strand:+ start:29 stop:1597 length:1569 start_codon:yes stop_codon:yes gene_type:complete
MGLLDNISQAQYYGSDNLGSYQFVSLEDIVNQFLIAYVGEEKIIGKARRTDVLFHAQRALAELSFDTFKSIKSQEITLPATNTMMLPHDYVNYTKISWSDEAGVKHPLYPTRHTSNPFPVLQQDDGGYDFDVSVSSGFLTNYDFTNSYLPPNDSSTSLNQWVRKGPYGNPVIDDMKISNNKLTFTHGSKNFSVGGSSTPSARIYSVWQKILLTGNTSIDIEATATSAAASAGVKGTGIVRIGVTSLEPTHSNEFGVKFNVNITNPLATDDVNGYYECATFDPLIFNLTDGDGNPSYMDFDAGSQETLTLTNIDTTNIDEDGDGNKYAYIFITSTVNNFAPASDDAATASTNTVDSILVTGDQAVSNLQREDESATWGNYKSTTPSENNNDDYRDDTYWTWQGERYGLEPSHAQVNGSFFIDNLSGLIHFSSNIGGKNVVLDYISDSLGTESEMKVHKFAEEAMYKWIMYAILSTRANTPEYIVRRYQKEKFAATRKAKLRLSNFKLEELTQILRGKSKHIKH